MDMKTEFTNKFYSWLKKQKKFVKPLKIVNEGINREKNDIV